jgi:hypothetical protein
VFGSSPSIYLQQDGGVAGNTQLRLNAAGGSNTGSVRLLDKYIWASTSNGSELKIGNDLTTAQMVLDSSGNLLVGTTSASAGNIFTKGILTRGTEKPLGVVCDSNGGSAAIGVGRTNSTGNYVEFYYGGAGTTFTGGISTNGSTTAFNTSSDYRLKDNIQPMVGALAKVQALKPVTWSWKNTGEQAEGFIAHELAEVCPDAVSGEKDAVDAEGNPKYQGVDTSFLVATLTAAIQELNAKVDSLQAELATLKGQA